MPVASKAQVAVCSDPAQAHYGFGDGHPFGPDRFQAFWEEMRARGLQARVHPIVARTASRTELETFHDAHYLRYVHEKCAAGEGWLDDGDTPARPGILEAAEQVVGATLNAVDGVMRGAWRRAFVPIAGLQHAGRKHAAGFCVLNDIGVTITHLRCAHGLERIAYVDIDADLLSADLREDGRFLYPGTGGSEETGKGAARGTKLNIPMPPGAGDEEFR